VRAGAGARAALVALASFVVTLVPGGAEAQQPPAQQQPQNPGQLPARRANYAWDKDLLRASFSYGDVLQDASVIKKLQSGLTTTIAMRAYVYKAGTSTPVALAPRVCKVVFDLWDEVFRVHISEPEGERDQAAVIEGVRRLCTEARDLAVVKRNLLTTGDPVFLGVVVDVNPVSQDMIDQMRRWLTKPTGSTVIGPSDALFGNFAQLFARQVATSDKSLTFRTQDVTP
jgi:hypothetical protein